MWHRRRRRARTSFPSWSRACTGSSTAATTPGLAVINGGLHRAARSTARVADLAAQARCDARSPAAPASPTRAGPRTARRRSAQRASALQQRRDRGRAQRHHREPRGAARAAAAAGLRVRHPDRHRGHRAPDRLRTDDGDLFEAVPRRVAELHGAYAIAVICRDEPHRVVGARAGSPLLLGVGERRELPRLRRDGARRRSPDRLPRGRRRRRPAAASGYWIVDAARRARRRAQVRTVQAHSGAAELGPYRHYMQKEIFEQPRADRRHARRRRRHRARAVRRRRRPASSPTSTRC